MPKSKVAEEIFALLFKIMVHNNGAIYFIQCAGCNRRRLPVGHYTTGEDDDIPSGERCINCANGLLNFLSLKGKLEIYEHSGAVYRLEELGILVPTLAPHIFPRYKQGSKIIWMEESLNQARHNRARKGRERMKKGDSVCVQFEEGKDYSYCRIVKLTKTYITLDHCGVVKTLPRQNLKIAIPERFDVNFKLDKDQ